MKLKLFSASVLLLGPSVQASSLVPKRYLDQDAKIPSQLLFRSIHRRAQACEDKASEEFDAEVSRLGEVYYDQIACEGDASSLICTWDASFVVSEGAFDAAAAMCADNGGTFFTLDAEVSCEAEGAPSESYTLTSLPFSCVSDCGTGAVLEAVAPGVVSPGPFVGKEEDDTSCEWVLFAVNPFADEDDDGDEDDFDFRGNCETSMDCADGLVKVAITSKARQVAKKKGLLNKNWQVQSA